MSEIAVALISGGLDSCVTAAVTRCDYKLAMLHVRYGQRTQEREYRAFCEIADHYGVEQRLVTSLDHLKQVGGSSLTDETMNVTEADLETGVIPTSYVPFRNAHLMAMATSWAETIGAVKIFFGAVEEDSSGYPDCRKSFVAAFNRLIAVGTKPETQLEIETPLIDLSKTEIVKLGFSLNAPLHLTWSCYQSTTTACGICDSCALRLRGFYRAGLRDPIPYAEDRTRELYH